jgi:hypothetical protein
LRIVSTDEGMQSDRSAEHQRNADSPKSETLQPASNTKSERASQHWKHELEIVSMDEGTQND